ncbi:MAG: DprA-like winged helix domain-containing protein [Solirubrobacterales bacterium]
MLGPGASLFGKAEPKLTAEPREVFDLVGRGHETADAVATAAQIPVAEAGAALLALELAGAVVSDQSGRYSAAA